MGNPVIHCRRKADGRHSILNVVELHKYLGQQINAILDDGESPADYVLMVREHYLIRPPEHVTRDRMEKVVFLIGEF